MARGSHLAREAVLCGPQSLLAWLISSWKAYQCVANKTPVETNTFFSLAFPKSVRICDEDIFIYFFILVFGFSNGDNPITAQKNLNYNPLIISFSAKLKEALTFPS